MAICCRPDANGKSYIYTYIGTITTCTMVYLLEKMELWFVTRCQSDYRVITHSEFLPFAQLYSLALVYLRISLWIFQHFKCRLYQKYFDVLVFTVLNSTCISIHYHGVTAAPKRVYASFKNKYLYLKMYK